MNMEDFNEVVQEDFDIALAKEQAYHKATKTMSKIGYNTTQEMLVDMLIEGFYNKEENTWTEITDPTEIQTNRNHMNLAQAKYYGVTIIRAGDEQPE